ncbi:hypothetical protein MMC07_008859 [Pseudocyphellaria aurata]|nr:hypothetical protein [Pseudocyphellaria aurata]
MRPTLKRAAKVGPDGQGRRVYGGSSVPLSNEEPETEPRSTPASGSNKRAKTAIVPVHSPSSAALKSYDDADHIQAGHDVDASLSLLTNCINRTLTPQPSSPMTPTKMSGSLLELSSASARSIAPRRQSLVPVLPQTPVALSKKVLLRPFGQPEVWADYRQNLCEALPWYKAYQSGSYTFKDLAFGFLLDKDSGERQYMDEEIVITRAGGGCTNENGIMRQSKDHERSAPNIQAFYNNQLKKFPVGLIVGSSNASCPTKIPHRYCVMGFFQVTHIWAEKSNGKTCFKFRFEKMDLESKSWWGPSGSPMPPRRRDRKSKTPWQICVSCGHKSVQIFQQAWICLNDACVSFWTVKGGELPADLTYNPAFLSERSNWPKQAMRPPFSLKTAPFKADPGHAELQYYSASWKGFVCPNCGRCNSRILWREWRCANKTCSFRQAIQLTPVPSSAMLGHSGAEIIGTPIPLDACIEELVLRDYGFYGHWRINTYELSPGNIITHFQANALLNHAAGGADDMFQAVQEAEMGLQRFPLTSSPIGGEMLTKHFATNFGMPYKYIVAVDSKSFSEAPPVILEGLAALTWAGRQTVSSVNGAEYQPCNELLALGYFENQKISYHDDGEKDLGPTIATLSLGGNAIMTIRMKQKYYSAEKHDSVKPILRGCQMFDERVQLEAARVNLSSAAFAIKQAEFEKAAKNGRSNCPPLVTLYLSHGDMVVMHGHDMQKYYEHQVVPLDKLRFALTARFVNPENIPESEHWKGKFDGQSRTGYYELDVGNDDDTYDDTDEACAMADVPDEALFDADSTMASHMSSQSAAETHMTDISTVKDESTSASQISLDHTNDATAVDAEAQRCPAPEAADSEAPTLSPPAQDQTIDIAMMDAIRLRLAPRELPQYTNESTYSDSEALQHPYNYALEDPNREPFGFDRLTGTDF